MSTPKKTRGDSVLGTLPEERQAQIAEYAQAHTLRDTIDWLKADGIKLSSGALSVWLSSWALRRQFRLADADTLEFIRLLRERNPNLPETELQDFGAQYFQMQAMKLGDPKTFLKFASARHKGKMDHLNFEQRERALKTREEALNLERERFYDDASKRFVALLREKPEQLKQMAATVANPRLSEAQKINAIRERLFGALPETPTTSPTQ